MELKNNTSQISVAFDYLQGKISLKQFTEALNSWQWGYNLMEWKKEKLWQQILESPPDDLEVVFTFYDSY